MTLRCEGPGLATDNPVAAAVIACPHCGTDNDIAFSSDGVVLRVRHVPARFRMPKSV